MCNHFCRINFVVISSFKLMDKRTKWGLLMCHPYLLQSTRNLMCTQFDPPFFSVLVVQLMYLRVRALYLSWKWSMCVFKLLSGLLYHQTIFINCNNSSLFFYKSPIPFSTMIKRKNGSLFLFVF